ncbi:DUF4157 domain-containing protein [Candidatus Poribacteria bacterium]|nr:DUF4157 domain-containing protein [Candidatus Poribacteria bacterium]
MSDTLLAKATEIPLFSGVTDSGFVQRIAHNYTKPPRAFLFSRYVLSKIQRRLTSGTSAVSIRNFVPYTLETLAVGKQASSENALASEVGFVGSLSESLLQPHLLKTSVKNKLGQFRSQTVREGGSPTEKRKPRADSDLSFSEEPSRVLSIKPVIHEVPTPNSSYPPPAPPKRGEGTVERSKKEGIISKSFLQKTLPGLTISLPFASLQGQVKSSGEPISKSFQREESSIPPSPFGINISRKPVSSVPVSINDASFADKVAGKSKSEPSIGSYTPSQIGQLKLATFREVASTASELTHVQGKKGHESLMEQTDVSARANRTGVQIEERDVFRAPMTQGTSAVSSPFVSPKGQVKLSGAPISELSRIEESSTPPSPFEGVGIFRKLASSIPVNINDVSLADKVAEKSKSEPSIVGSDTHSQIGQLKLATRHEATPIGRELTHVQRKKGHERLMEQPDAIIDRKTGTDVQLGTRDTLRAPTPQFPLTGTAPAPSFPPVDGGVRGGAESARSILAGATPILANRKMAPVVQSLSGLKPTIGIWQDKILIAQYKSAGGVSTDTYRQTAEQTRESTNNVIARATRQSESPPLTTDNINVLRRSVSPASVVISEALARPAVMVGRGAAEEIAGGMQPLYIGNAMRIFRRYLDMPHVQLHNDASANFMAAKLNAEAFTIGRDVFFASGKLNLSTPRGIALLAHAFTHVKQQEETGAVPFTTTPPELSGPPFGKGERGSGLSFLNASKMSASQPEALESEALTNEQATLSFLSVKPQAFTYSQSDSPMIARKYGQVSNPPLPDEPVELTHIPQAFGVGERSEHSPQLQYAVSQTVSTSLKDNPIPLLLRKMAEEGRGMETSMSTETPAPPPPEPTTTGIDINRIAEEVYSIIERRLRSEKERRGYF